MAISAFGDSVPRIGSRVFVHPAATIIGDVVLEDGANVWPGAVLRGDMARIVVGRDSSFQDNAVAHADGGFPLTIGPECIVGHLAVVHGCTIGARCLVGMGSILLNGCEIGEESIVGAGALVPEGRRFPPRSVIIGTPAKVLREVTDEDLAPRVKQLGGYVARAQRFVELGLGADLAAFRR